MKTNRDDIEGIVIKKLQEKYKNISNISINNYISFENNNIFVSCEFILDEILTYRNLLIKIDEWRDYRLNKILYQETPN